MTVDDTYNCVVMGGGPAGATAGALLARHGHSTLVLEKDPFPRHQIGESLMPQTYWTFQRLGVLDQLEASAFPRKESVQFVSASGKESQPYYFSDRDPRKCSVTWQVRRDEFDRMMLDNARKCGATVQERARVVSVLFDGTRATGVKVNVDGDDRVIRAKVVVDATGQSTLLSRQLNLRQADPDLKQGAIYAYYKNAVRDEGRNAGATIIIHTPNRDGWFWFIPLPDDLSSVGLVAPPSVLFGGRGGDPLVPLEEEIARCPHMAARLEHAQRVSDPYVTRDFSYRSKRMAGDGWVLIGDAFGFLDPVYSSGVMLALKGGEMAADAIHEALVAGDVSGDRLSTFAPELIHGMEQIRKLVYAFYDRDFSFSKFHKDYPKYKDHLVRILIGDVFNNDVGEMFDVMGDWVNLPQAMQLEGTAGSS